MRRFRQLAGERLLALCAALAAASGGSSALAQEDPFALPRNLTAQSVAAADGPGLSEISIDGNVRARLIKLAWRGRELLIDAEAARAAGLPVPDSTPAMIPLAGLRISKWGFDSVHQRLDIELLRRSDGDNLIDLSPAQRSNGVSAPLTALIVNYDLTATMARGRFAAAGLAEATLVRNNAALTSAFQFATSTDAATPHVVRLDSQLQVLFPTKGWAVTAGDYISAGGQSQRALRLGGVQIASDYSLRPDLVTIPLPSFTGQVAVPTGIDLINGDQRFKLGEVAPGEFTVRNVPVSPGRGEVSIITRDTLGREVIQSARFYVSRNLLARNLSEFAVNAGFVRRRYGVRSMDYGPIAASAYFRRGLSAHLTVEGTAEWTPGIANIGARGDLALGGVALATIEARVSRDAADGVSGTLLNFGLESSGRRISGRIGAILPSKNYHDVAFKLGDAAQPRQFFAQFSFDLGHMNQLQLSATRQERRFDPRFPRLDLRSDIVSASFRANLRRNVDFVSSLAWRKAEKSAFSVFAGVSVQLGAGRHAQASLSKSGNSPVSGAIGFARHDVEGIPLGYAFDRSFGMVARTAASVAYRSPVTRVEGQAEHVGGHFALRGNARGTLIVAGGGIFARNQTGGSYALVRTGRIDGIAVKRENRSAGVTAHGGLLLIENIPAQVPISFDIDADKLPADALARDTHRSIIVPRRAVGLVRLDVVHFVPRQIRLVKPDGTPLIAGLLLKALPSGEATMTGFDGVVDFNQGGTDRRIAAMGDGENACIADIELAEIAPRADPEALPQFVCRQSTRDLIAEQIFGGRRKARGPPPAASKIASSDPRR